MNVIFDVAGLLFDVFLRARCVFLRVLSEPAITMKAVHNVHEGRHNAHEGLINEFT
jgi:hypothetical protein